MRKLYSIEGMHCAACSSSIERILSKKDGVSFVNVSLLTKRMNIEFDPSKISEEDIFSWVSKAGFKAKEYKKDETNELSKIELKRENLRLIFSLILLLPLLVISFYVNRLDLAVFSSFVELKVYKYVCAEFALVIPLLIINRRFYKSGFKALFSKSPNMDSLVALGSSISFIYGLVSFIFATFYYFSKTNLLSLRVILDDLCIESSATVLVFVSIGKYIENKITSSNTSYITSLFSLLPSSSHLLVDGKVNDIDSLTLKIGDVILVKEGESIAADGLIIEGSGSFNEAALSGESLPIFKDVGDNVIAGGICSEGLVKVKVTHIGDDSTLSKVASLIEETSSSKGKLSKLADRISLFFVPAILLISLITFIVWLIISSNFLVSLKYAISTLVISCPCALGLATPIACLMGSLTGAKHGLLIKSVRAFEELAKIDSIYFDKTGTLTKGNMKVREFINLSNDESILDKVASVELNSIHPLSKAIVNYVSNSYLTPSTSFSTLPGIGVKDKDLYIGNEKLFNSLNLENTFKSHNKDNLDCTILYVIEKKLLKAIFYIGDEIKEDTLLAISSLKELGISSSIVSGDNYLSVSSLANKLNVESFYSEASPEDKVKILSKGLENQRIAYVGDGVNDSPTLKLANVGIAIGAGAQIALDCADVILVNNNIIDIVNLIKLSKKVNSNIKTNLFWAFLYNIILIPLAAGVFSSLGIKLTPTLASLAMSASSVCVVLNALRIKLFKVRK